MKQTEQDVVIANRSKQLIVIEACPPNGDFYLHRQNIYLRPNKSMTIGESYINENQIRNLQARGQISVTYKKHDDGCQN